MSTAGIILAAGFSRRLGRDKQRLLIRGEMLVERAVRVAVATGLQPVIAVVRERELIAPLLALGAVVLVNHEAVEGMASSIRAGLKALVQEDVQGVMLMTCDQVMLRAEHLQSLSKVPDRITASSYSGRKGVPAYFPASALEALQQLQGDEGARSLLKDAAVVENEDLALDIDTEEDFLRALALLEKTY